MIRNKGFSIVEVVIIIAVVGIIGLIGWRVWDANQTKTTDQTDTTQSTPEVNSESDLDKVDTTLDSMNVEGQEAKQLDSQTSF